MEAEITSVDPFTLLSMRCCPIELRGAGGRARKDDSAELTDKQARIIQRVARGETWPSAAKAEGCRDSYARVIRTRMMKKPAVVKEIEASQAALREKTLFSRNKQASESRSDQRRPGSQKS